MTGTSSPSVYKTGSARYHIRWVAIQIGNGTIGPHTADEVLLNGYGDCKDQVMLLVALMRAKDLAADPALINSGNSYTSPGAAVVGAFTHCITYLPEWDIGADTARRSERYRSRITAPVVHAVLQGEVRRNTPVLPPGAASMSLNTRCGSIRRVR